MMQGFEYGNTRLRAMKSRLITRQEMLSLAEKVNIEDFLLGLARTNYQKSVQRIMAQFSAAEVVSMVIQDHLFETFLKLRSFFTMPEKGWIERFLWHYEVHNIKTILRGVTQHYPVELIRHGLVPTGLIQNEILRNLSEYQEVEQVVREVISLGLPYAAVLLENYRRDLIRIEIELEKWYFSNKYWKLNRRKTAVRNLCKTIAMEADLVNLLTVLRIRGDKTVSEQQFKDHLVSSGEISFSSLKKFSDSEDLLQAAKSIRHPVFSKAINQVLEQFQIYENPTDIEKKLRFARLNWYARFMRQDPLGLGVPFGFLVLKLNEIRNIYWISRGIIFKMLPQTIQNNLEFAG